MTWKSFISQEFEIIGGVTIYMDHILLAAAILIGTWVSIVILRRLITRPSFIADKIGKKRRMTVFLLIKYFAWFISIFVSLKVLGINITALMLGSTALLVGLGLGLQNIFKDLVSGLFLLFEGSIKIGDVIEADGVIGKVVEINLRSSEVMTRDDVIIIIPNSKFVAEKVVNWSHDSEQVRFTVDINLAYGSDVEKVFSCLELAMKEDKRISKTPEAFVRFTDFGESSLHFQMFFWSNDMFRIENVKSDLRRLVYNRLAENGLAIPFPQRDIHIKGMEQMVNFKQKD
ncbi:MAG: small-conductance mechanosensitive channel [Crocinitomicaceae bacterium]|jgi:small-conductance mechanosensitive channel